MPLPGPINLQAESLGGWCSIPSSLTAEIIGRAGFDWVCIDTQHGPIGLGDLVPMLQALDAAGVPALVRVAWNDRAAISHALDSGAIGVIVPMVNSADEAATAAAACRYAPAGARSYGPTRAALRDPAFQSDAANIAVLCFVQIETEEAIAHLDDIASTPGVDGLFVGPADLALSLGTPAGSLVDERFRAATREVVRAARAHARAPGVFCATMEAAETAREDGFTMLAIQSDVRLLKSAAAEALSKLRAHQGT